MSEPIKFDGMVPEGTPGTYGGVTRAKVPEGSLRYEGSGGQLTMEMIENAFKVIERMDEQYRQQENEFYSKLHPYSELASKDFVAYFAIYRLYRSSIWPECALHPQDAKELIELLKSKGIELQ